MNVQEILDQTFCYNPKCKYHVKSEKNFRFETYFDYGIEYNLSDMIMNFSDMEPDESYVVAHERIDRKRVRFLDGRKAWFCESCAEMINVVTNPRLQVKLEKEIDILKIDLAVSEETLRRWPGRTFELVKESVVCSLKEMMAKKDINYKFTV
jgi:hypothetical protein